MRFRTWAAAGVIIPAALLATAACKPINFTVSHDGHTATCQADPNSTSGECNGFTVAPVKSSADPHRTPVPTVSTNPAPAASTSCVDPDHDNDCDNNTDEHGHH